MSWINDAAEWVSGLSGSAIDAGLALQQAQMQRDVGVAQAQAQAAAAGQASAVTAQADAAKSKTVLYVVAGVAVLALFLRQTRSA